MHRRTDPLRIRLTGPIGAGKSTVRDLLAGLGCAVIDADSVGHGVLLPDGPAFDAVAARWPEVVSNGAIDRKRLAGIVFEDRGRLAELEAITHPAISAEIARRVAWLADRDVLVELPLIDGVVNADRPWHRLVVIADEAVRLERLVLRGVDEDDARRRMLIQPPGPEWERNADSLIVNNGGLEALEGAVHAWWREHAAH